MSVLQSLQTLMLAVIFMTAAATVAVPYTCINGIIIATVYLFPSSILFMGAIALSVPTTMRILLWVHQRSPIRLLKGLKQKVVGRIRRKKLSNNEVEEEEDG